MIKRLRKKFIIVTMCSVLAVLVLIVGIINIVNYTNVIRNADYVISVLKDGGGKFGKFENGEQTGDGFGGILQRPVSPETPFRTRFFTVTINENGEVTANTDKIAAIGETQAIDYAYYSIKRIKLAAFTAITATAR